MSLNLLMFWDAGEEVDSIDYWAGQVRQLENEIVDARRCALEGPPCASFFVFFKTQKDAAVAAQTNIHPEDGRSFRVVEAPGPEEVTHRCCQSVCNSDCMAFQDHIAGLCSSRYHSAFTWQ